MALTEAQVAEIRQWVGDSPVTADLDAIFARDGSVRAVVLDVLRRRRANLAAAPKSLAIPGEFSQSNRDVKELDGLLDAFEDATLETEVVGSSTQRVKRLVRPYYGR